MARFLPYIALLFMGLAGSLVSDLKNVVNPPFVAPSYDAQEDHATTSLLGQFRTSASSWLWLRTDLYLHNGVEMRQMTDQEKHAGISTESAADDGNKPLLNETSVLTTIPSKDRDFRGVFGDVERAVSAYKDMHQHKHKDAAVALPLFRLMTWVDPDFVPGWVQGAAIIARDRSEGSAIKAIEYLQDGQRQDPFSVSIAMEIGALYINRLHNLTEAVGYLEHARELGEHRDWVSDETENRSLQQDYRWLALTYRNLTAPKKEHAILVEGLHRYPDDLMMQHLLFPAPWLLKPDLRVKWVQQKMKEERIEEQKSVAAVDDPMG